MIDKANVFLALDVDCKDAALKLSKKWSPYIKGFKVGPRLGFQLSNDEWQILSEQGELFLDYKFFDIPSTVLSSVKRAFNLGSSFCTVHALNGEVCLKELSLLEKELNKLRPFRILAVTLLTSFDQTTNKLPLVSMSSEGVVKSLSDAVVTSGLEGIVCSATEASFIKESHPNLFLVCPGIRFTGDETSDQKRVVTPKKAFQNGADFLVMGRSLINIKDPKDVLKEISL